MPAGRPRLPRGNCAVCGKQLTGRRDRTYCSLACAHVVNDAKITTPPEERFRRYFTPGDPDECWPWQGAIHRSGYGVFSLSHTQQVIASRFSYELHVGPIPDGMQVLHHCDNPVCVNPNHFFLGNTLDNNNDKVMKGRHARGEKHGRAKLTEAQVRQIRQLRPFYRAPILAEMFDVGVSAITDIFIGRTWKHLL